MDSNKADVRVAWISRGRLFVKTGEQPAREIESEFARQSLLREFRDSELNAWKGRSGVWGNLGMQPPGMAPWENAESQRQIRFVSIGRGASADEILYVLDMGSVGGLFCYDLKDGVERRLVHRQGYVLRDLSRHPVDGELAVALPRDDGTVGLKITRHDGLFGRDITLSDSLDESPAWLPDGSRKLVFQSAAIGRNEHGYAVGQSPFRVEMLDLSSQEVTTVYEDDENDLLQPRLLQDGSLVCIRRPYTTRPSSEQISFTQYLQDVVLFPYRLLRTFVHFFHFMSMMFSGKPLISAGGPGARKQPGTNPYLMLWGQAIDTQRILNQEKPGGPRKPLVPKEWQLIQRGTDGSETKLADNVLAWDLSGTGVVFYTDGRAVYRVLDSGRPEEVFAADMIERLLVLG